VTFSIEKVTRWLPFYQHGCNGRKNGNETCVFILVFLEVGGPGARETIMDTQILFFFFINREIFLLMTHILLLINKKQYQHL